MSDTGKLLLSALDISKIYAGIPALDGISIDIYEGEFLTLLGPSGSGKTTFLMCLAGFIEPTSGKLLDQGLDITSRPAEARRYGMVFQGYALFPHMTVARNVDFPLQVAGLSSAVRAKRVTEMLQVVGLTEYRNRRPSQLSGGQQQRVALARALVSNPKVLLLDEPLSALDKNLREQMQDELKSLQKKTGNTFVFVTHDQTEALSLSSRVAIFNKGRLQQIGTPQDVYERPANRFVAEFLGRINLIPLEDTRAEKSMVSGRFEGRVLKARSNGAVASKTMIAVRPEYMELSAGPPPADRNAVRARVVDCVYGGANSVLQLTSVSGIPLSLDVRSSNESPALIPGQDVWVMWPEDKGFALSGLEDKNQMKEE